MRHGVPHAQAVAVAGGKLISLSAIAPRRCTLYADGSVVQDIPNFRYGVGGTRPLQNSFVVTRDGGVTGTFENGALGAGKSGVRLVLDARKQSGN